MKKKRIMLGLLCFWTHSILAESCSKELHYNVENLQDKTMILHCNLYHPTGEKGPSFDRTIVPGKNNRLIRQNLDKNCKEVAVVVCKLKQAPSGSTMEYFWVAIPCEKIKSQHALELQISRDNHLTAHYP